MDIILDQRMECLCCGQMVYISSQVWKATEAPVALCQSCAQSTPQAMIRVLYLVRSQIRSLYEEQDSLRRDIKRLYAAQEDLEQSFVEPKN